ncbi:MAG: HAMP domain-containing histidine kinase [Anaerolineae bacterium]|nr:HAMP domain-containing histidine kinase [Anaerolineae bacterium]
MALDTQEFIELQAYIQSLETDNQHLQATLRDLLNNLSHDLRTPLAAVKNSLYLLEKHLDDAKRSHYLDILNAQTTRMEQLLSDISTLSRLESRATTFELQRLNLNWVLDALLERYATLIREKNHTVSRRFAPELPRVLADEVKISRALVI